LNGDRLPEPIGEKAMKTSASTARRAVQGLGSRGKTTRIPDEVRSVVLRYARGARASGQSWIEIAEAVGLSTSALQRWNRAVPKKVKLKPVVITDALASASRGDLVLATANGDRLEGLSVEEAICLVRALR
jgi:transposase